MKRILALLLSLIIADSARASTFWVEGEYLLWWIKENPVSAPLLTKASFDDPIPGAIGQPGTHVVLGDKDVHMGGMNGFRVGGGVAVLPRFNIGGNYFLLPRVDKKRTFHTSGEPGSPNYAVPIFDVTGVCGLNGVPGETVFILPGPLGDDPGFFGEFDFRISSRLQGAELNGFIPFFKRSSFRLEGFAGFRWFQLDESLHLNAKTHTVPDVSFPAGFFNFSDRFATMSNFLGGQLGLEGQYKRKRWKLEGDVTGALGAVLERVNIEGSSRTSGGNLFFETAGTAGETLNGGIFAEPTNIGKHKKTKFAYAFEARVGAGYKLTKNIGIDLGYNFLWLSRVLRPGKQIDRKINTTLTALADASRETVGTGPGPIPFGSSGPAPAASGPKRPSVHFRSSTFYVQGLDVGLNLAF